MTGFFEMMFEDMFDAALTATINEIDFNKREEFAHKYATERVNNAVLLMSIKNRKRIKSSKHKS